MRYGLDETWFWQEVALRAKNNYGQWKSVNDIHTFIDRAISEIMLEISDSALNDNQAISNIINEMESIYA